MAKARTLGVPCSDKSIAYIQEHAGEIDLVFDATSAKDHAVHAPILKELDIRVIDLTPAKISPMCIPAVNMDASLGKDY
jgi:acetaldehyde dehydrogenase